MQSLSAGCCGRVTTDSQLVNDTFHCTSSRFVHLHMTSTGHWSNKARLSVPVSARAESSTEAPGWEKLANVKMQPEVIIFSCDYIFAHNTNTTPVQDELTIWTSIIKGAHFSLVIRTHRTSEILLVMWVRECDYVGRFLRFLFDLLFSNMIFVFMLIMVKIQSFQSIYGSCYLRAFFVRFGFQPVQTCC